MNPTKTSDASSARRPFGDQPRRAGRTNRKMTVIAVVLMLGALFGYVVSMDEEWASGCQGPEEERMPAAAE